MRISRALRWTLVPFAAIAGWVSGLIFVMFCGALLRMFVPGAQIESLLRIDARTGVLGAAAAFGTVVAGSESAPSAHRATSLILLALGGLAAWFALRHWTFPEHHPLEYEVSHLPLALTYVGGVIGTARTWWYHRPRRG